MDATIEEQAADISDDRWVPLATAHKIIGVGKSTVYRWAHDGRLVTEEVDGVTLVRAGELRECFRRIKRGRRRDTPGNRQYPESENVRYSFQRLA